MAVNLQNNVEKIYMELYNVCCKIKLASKTKTGRK